MLGYRLQYSYSNKTKRTKNTTLHNEPDALSNQKIPRDPAKILVF